ncbi:autoinducer binding domain-containing protein [Ciceribacter sp. L1K23]|uniref:helix-turn-helix transcriptional regulator n=1 Tax=Ciceribacter sp. L1K23 TaxID=2820276 RepID=UPI001B82D879|nr:autoinducer binding domain-containing protein [Ciceribacter sp. L1K23]MBR0555283.1 autoinducer binding domain-containing protein [Ciceribacter sp. L1K23]
MSETEDCPDGRKRIVARIHAAETLTGIGEALSLIQVRLGFSFYKIFVSQPEPGASFREQLLLNNFPDEFFTRLEQTGVRVPTPEELFHSGESRTFVWTRDFVERAYQEPERCRVLELLDDYQLHLGVYFSLHAVEGPNRIVAFYGNREPLSASELDDFSLLSFQLLHRVYTLEKRGGGWPAGVSALDMECLTLAASGLDSSAIAQKMGFSARTVNYLVSSVCSKLGVDTLEHAVTEALRRGFIS